MNLEGHGEDGGLYYQKFEAFRLQENYFNIKYRYLSHRTK